MGECIEKIYCCDRDNNDNALAAAILANGNNNRYADYGMNAWANNPFAYLMFELSQERQNNLINERFNRLGNCGCGWNNNCGCGNGCGC